jgi:hypothetical protein
MDYYEVEAHDPSFSALCYPHYGATRIRRKGIQKIRIPEIRKQNQGRERAQRKPMPPYSTGERSNRNAERT